jgi:hypothetical protein
VREGRRREEKIEGTTILVQKKKRKKFNIYQFIIIIVKEINAYFLKEKLQN